VSDLLVGLLSAVLSTNTPVAVSNLVAEKTGISIPVINTNDPVEAAYYKVLQDDDAAEKDVIKWTDDAETFSKAGAGDQRVTLHLRIQKRLDGIKAEYEDFIAHHPDHAHIRLAYGSFLNDIHDEEGSVAQWEKARELDPKNPAAWNNLANYYGHRSPVKKAFEYYAKAIELDSKEPVYYENLATTVYLFRIDAEEYYHLNETQVFDKALELYRKAIALDPDNFVLFSDYAESFYGTKPPRWQDGLTAWTQALKIAHDDVEREGVYIHLARINLKLGHYDEVRRNLDVVTNTMYAQLKGRITRNLNEALTKPATNAPAPVPAVMTNTQARTTNQ
jgi:tetratricopeptide (TPR) repeat protein